MEDGEAENEAIIDTPPKKMAWEVEDGVYDHVQYVGTGGEIWMEGEKCENCDNDDAKDNDDDDEDDGIDGGNADYFVTARRNLATVKLNEVKQCNHEQKASIRKNSNESPNPKEETKKNSGSEKGSKDKSSNDKDGSKKSNPKISSQQKKKSSTHNKFTNPSKPQDQVLRTNNSKHVSNAPLKQVIQHPLASLKTPVSVSGSSTYTKSDGPVSSSSSPFSNGPTNASFSSSSSERSSLLPGGQTLNKENLASLVKEFNKISKGLSLNVLEDGVTVRGFIRVHLDLMRPGKSHSCHRPRSVNLHFLPFC